MSLTPTFIIEPFIILNVLHKNRAEAAIDVQEQRSVRVFRRLALGLEAAEAAILLLHIDAIALLVPERYRVDVQSFCCTSTR